METGSISWRQLQILKKIGKENLLIRPSQMPKKKETKNLSKGLHLILISKIMTLIGIIGTSLFFLLPIWFFLFVSLALLFIGLIFILMGLGKASKDDSRFKTVLIFALSSIGGLIFGYFVLYMRNQILANIITSTSMDYASISIYGMLFLLFYILKIASTALDLIVIIMTIIITCDALEIKGLDNLGWNREGKGTLKRILVTVIIQIIVQIIFLIGMEFISGEIVALLIIVEVILNIVYVCFFNSFISKASPALA